MGYHIPKSKVVMHSCDNRLCCNPHHLSIGSSKENRQDCVAKNRQYRPMGEKNVQAKLTQEAVDKIRSEHKTESNSMLASYYNVAPITIRRIRANETWKV